jgi:hypothetical protein
MSTGTGGRVLCSKCGANNFDTQAACWKCSTPLTGAGYAGGGTVSRPVPPPSVAPTLSPNLPNAPIAPAYAPAAYQARVDPSVGFWASIALAVFFPAIAVPVGIVFLMLDDRRKGELGKLTLIAGIISSIVHSIVTAWLVQALFMTMFARLPQLIPGLGERTGSPNLNQSVPGLKLPGIPETPEQVPFPSVPIERPMPR